MAALDSLLYFVDNKISCRLLAIMVSRRSEKRRALDTVTATMPANVLAIGQLSHLLLLQRLCS